MTSRLLSSCHHLGFAGPKAWQHRAALRFSPYIQFYHVSLPHSPSHQPLEMCSAVQPLASCKVVKESNHRPKDCVYDALAWSSREAVDDAGPSENLAEYWAVPSSYNQIINSTDTRRAEQGRRRPYVEAGEEPLCSTFKAMSILLLIPTRDGSNGTGCGSG